jgi:hypothetical protein
MEIKRYELKNFNPASVRKSLRRACKRAAYDFGAVLLDITLKPDRPSEEFGRRFQAYSLGSVIGDMLEILDPLITKEEAQEGETGEMLLPLEAIESCQVIYNTPDIRKIGTDGVFEFRGATYLVPDLDPSGGGILPRRVKVLFAEQAQEVFVEDLEDGQVYPAYALAPGEICGPPSGVLVQPLPVR